MAQSYTRQSSFSDGDTITAALFNNEYNQLVNAFAYSSSSASSTGHRHDGTAGHGGNIHTIGDLDFLNKIVADSTNNRWGVFVEVSSAAVEQIRIQDGAIVPVTDNDIDLGTSSLEFKDAYFDGTITTDLLTVSGATNLDGAIQVDNTITVGVDDTGYDVKFFGDTASAYMLWDTSADDLVLAGAAGLDVAGDIDVDGTSNLDNTDIDGTLAVDGTTISLDATTSLNIDNSNTSNGITIGTATSGVPISIGHTTSEVTVNDNLTVTGTLTLGSGAELTEAELEMLDGITAGTVAASKAVVVDSNKDAASFRNITLTGELDAATLDISGDADIDGTLEADAYTVDGTALNEYIADTVGAMVSSNTESGITVAYEDGDNTLDFTVGTLNQDTTGTADNITVSANNSTDETVYPIFVDGATGSQGAESDTGLTYNPSSGLLTISGELDAGSLDISGNADIDGTLEADAYTVDGTALNEYIADTVGAMVGSNTETNITVTYEDGDNTLDFVIGTLNQDTTGTADNITVSANNSTDETVYPVFVDGATGSQGAESDTGLTYNPSTGMLTTTGVTATFTGNITGNVTGNTSGTAATVTGAAQSNITSLGTLTTLTVDNVIVNGTTIGHTSDTDLITLADGNVTIAGELDLTTLDVSGNADIDGTLEADAITVDGTALDEYVTDLTGAMFSGNTESGITVTFQDGDNTIDLAVDAAQTGITSLLATDIKIGEDDQTKIDFETADEIHFYAANAEQVYVADGIFGPQTDSDVDLGSSSVRWKDAYIDSLTTTGAVSVGGNLTVNGTTTTVNSTTVTVDDPIFTLGGDSAPGSDDNKDRGIEFRWHNGSAAKLGFFGYDDSASAFTFVPDASNSSEVFSGSAGNAVFGDITGTGLTIDTSTLVVDSSNNRVGVGNASPDVSLDIGSVTDAIHVPSGTTAQRPGSPAAGYFRYNTTTGDFEGYTDSWGAIAGAGGTAPVINTMTGDGSDTTLTLTSAPVNENATVVTIDGVVQHKDTYSVSSNTLTFSEAPPDDTAVECITWVNTTLNSALLVQDADGDTQIQVEESSDEDKIRFDTGGTERMVLDSTGLTLATNLVVDSGTIKLDGSYPTGTENTALGDGALDAIEATGNYNVAIGKDSFTDLTTGDYNVAVGRRAGYDLTTGSENIAIGYLSLYAATTASNNIAIGTSALQANTTGTDNVAVGDRAGTAITTGGNNTFIGDEAGKATTTADYNVGIGASVMEANTTGASNVAVGMRTLDANTTGSNNTALGQAAMGANTDANNNVAVGYVALGANTTGAANTAVGATALDAATTANYNVGVGYAALGATTTGADNTAVGSGALEANTTASNNTAVGRAALQANTTATENTAVGYNALKDNTTGHSNVSVGSDTLANNTTANHNTAVGREAMVTNTTGSSNTALGRQALQANTTADNNTAVGYQSLYLNTTGSDNNAFGYGALQANTTGSDNTGLAKQALYSNTTGSNNTGVGDRALNSNTTASNNTAVGKDALYANTTGTDQTAVGAYALQTQTTNGYNTAIGRSALESLTTGEKNVVVGAQAMDAATTADQCVAIGYNAGGALTTGDFNTVVGYEALITATTGERNVAVGRTAMNALTTGKHNVAIGMAALESITTPDDNTSVGYNSMNAATTGYSNTCVGKDSGAAITTGYKNVFIGHDAGDTTTTGDYNIILGTESDVSGTNTENEIVIGQNAAGKGSSTAFITPNGGNVYQGTNGTAWAQTSDRRIKKNIVDNKKGLEIINQVKIRNFEYRTVDEIVDFENPKSAVVKQEGIQLGTIAQELEEFLPEVVITEKTGVKTVDAENFTWYLINAVQELSAKVIELESKIEE